MVCRILLFGIAVASLYQHTGELQVDIVVEAILSVPIQEYIVYLLMMFLCSGKRLSMSKLIDFNFTFLFFVSVYGTSTFPFVNVQDTTANFGEI